MTASKNCYHFIREVEGCELEAYLDDAGVPTIGVGTTMYPSGKKVQMGDTCTPEQAELYLAWEVENKTKSIKAFVSNVVLNQNQFDALVSFAYNIGVGAFEGSTLLKKLKKNPNDPTIEDEFLRWNKLRKNGKLVPSNGLTNRRKKEAALYFKPIATNNSI